MAHDCVIKFENSFIKNKNNFRKAPGAFTTLENVHEIDYLYLYKSTLTTTIRQPYL